MFLAALLLPGASAARAESAAEVGNIVAEPGGLTSRAVETRAVEKSAQLAEKAAELAAANARVEQTRRQFFPQLGVRASYTRLSPLTTSFGSGAQVGSENAGLIGLGPCLGNPAATCSVDAAGGPLVAERTTIAFPNDNYALNANLTVPLSDFLLRMSDANAVAAKNRDSAKYMLEAERLRVRSDARVLYFNWLRTHGQVSIAQQAVQQARARREEAQAAFDLGAIGRADLLKIEALVANAERAAAQAQTARSFAGRQIAIAMSDAGGQEYAVGEGVPTVNVVEADLGPDPKLFEAALARRLEPRALDAAAESLEHGRSATSTARGPRLDAVGQVDYGNPNQRYFPPTSEWNVTWSVGLVASWNVSEALITGARVHELSAKRAAVLAQRELLAQGIAREIAAAQAEVKNAQAALSAAGVTLEAQQEGYRVAAEAFRLGQVTATFLVDAESDLLNARLALLDGRIDLATAMIRLEHALGRDAPTQ
jgi:outer membrane protein TolC